MREGLQVTLQGVQRHSVSLGALSQQFGIVNTLSSRDNLLSADEDIEGVGELLLLSLFITETPTGLAASGIV